MLESHIQKEMNMSERISIRAVNIGNDDIGCYVSVMSAKQIYAMSTVVRIKDDPDNGYQRLLVEKRARDISEYLDNGNIIPGSIILSAQAGTDFSYKADEDMLEIDTSSCPLFVIDGQHRLYGANMSKQDVKLPVCIFTGLNLKQEVQYFLDINSYQKGVPRTLRIELLKFLSEPDSIDAVRVKLFQELGEETDSPLFNKTSAAVSVQGKISHVPFEKAINPILEGKHLKPFTYEQKKQLIKNYLSAVERVLLDIDGNSSKLTQSAFFEAIFKVFDEACSFSLTFFKNYTSVSLQSILSGIKTIDFERHSGSNQQTINNMADEMKSLLENHCSRFDMPNDLL